MAPTLPSTPDLLGERLTGLHILVMGTCQVDPLVSSAAGIGHKIDHMLFQSWRHTEIPQVDVGSVDATVVALTLRHIIGDASGENLGPSDMIHARPRSATETRDLIDRCATVIREKLDVLHPVLVGAPTFFLSFLEPSFNYAGDLLNPYSTTSAKYFMRNLNEKFHDVVRSFSNFYFVDTNDVANFVGRMHLYDDVVSASSHASFIGDADLPMDKGRLIEPIANSTTYETETYTRLYGEVLWNLIADDLKILRQISPVKLIIVDLDDTLWRGVAAESNVEHWFRIEGWPLGFVEALLHFKNRGGLLAVCSKNDAEPTLQRLATIWGGAITPDDFASIKINWSPKSENIAEIISEVNVLPQNILFIDDNPREIDEVKSQYPTMRFLGGNHYDWRRIILRAPETQVPVVTEESAQRTKLIQARVEREALSQALPREEWLKSLNIEQRVFVLRDGDSQVFDRAFELINKTNQFNTTGKRWDLSEFQALLADGGVCVLTSLKDKTVDNGIIGAALVKHGEIVQTVLSCRVFGLGAEISLGRVATLIALSQAGTATGRIVDTGKNFACHKYFETLGFERRDDHFETSQACAAPSWITLLDRDALAA